jgi:hypothetical protein
VNVPLVSWHFTLMMCLIHHLPPSLGSTVAHRVTPRGWPRPAGEKASIFSIYDCLLVEDLVVIHIIFAYVIGF